METHTCGQRGKANPMEKGQPPQKMPPGQLDTLVQNKPLHENMKESLGDLGSGNDFLRRQQTQDP